MADDPRQKALALNWLRRLESTPYRFGFFTALRRLEAIYRDKPRIGYAARPVDESTRVGQHVSLTFAASTLASFSRSASASTYRLQTNFFGLFGPNGAMPLHLTEYVYERMQTHRDRTPAAFADVFHHRMATYFYRAWADSQPTVQFDRPEADRFATYVGSLLGLGMPSLRHRDAMPDETKLHFAGHLGAQTRHASGLQAVLKSFLRVPVEIEQFVGHWLEMPDDCRLRLGGDRSTVAQGDSSAKLGESAVLGRRIWDRRQTFQLRLGPMSFADYQRMLPGGDSLRRLDAVIKNYVGLTLRWNAQLVLRREEIPSLQLGRQGKLGWTTWLRGRKPSSDAAELVLRRSCDAA
jgi:type VI secretion system protein ImpH